MSATFPARTSDFLAFKGRSRATAYFNALLKEYRSGCEPCLFLPSLMDLSQQLDCSPLDIQAVLAGLRQQEADFFFMTPESPITFWLPDKITLLAETAPP